MKYEVFRLITDHAVIEHHGRTLLVTEQIGDLKDSMPIIEFLGTLETSTAMRAAVIAQERQEIQV